MGDGSDWRAVNQLPFYRLFLFSDRKRIECNDNNQKLISRAIIILASHDMLHDTIFSMREGIGHI